MRADLTCFYGEDTPSSQGVLEVTFDSRAGRELPGSHIYPKELMIFLCHGMELVPVSGSVKIRIKSQDLRSEQC